MQKQEPEPKLQPKPEPKAGAKATAKAEPQLQSKKPKPEPKAGSTIQPKPKPKPTVGAKAKTTAKTTAKSQNHIRLWPTMRQLVLVPVAVLARRASGTVRRGWRRYSRLMDSHGWRAQAANTAVLMAAGDVLAQCLIERRRLLSYDFDAARTLRFAAGGLFVFGPTMHVWYSALDRFVVKARTPLRLAVCKMLCDQLGFLPVYLASYISFFSTLEGNDVAETKERVETMFGKLLMFSYKLWPAVQIANFYFVPLHHRILVINAVGLVYYTYIDWSVEQHHNHCKNGGGGSKKTAYCAAVEVVEEEAEEGEEGEEEVEVVDGEREKEVEVVDGEREKEVEVVDGEREKEVEVVDGEREKEVRIEEKDTSATATAKATTTTVATTAKEETTTQRTDEEESNPSENEKAK